MLRPTRGITLRPPPQCFGLRRRSAIRWGHGMSLETKGIARTKFVELARRQLTVRIVCLVKIVDGREPASGVAPNSSPAARKTLASLARDRAGEQTSEGNS